MDGCSFARLSESAKFLSRNLERISWEKSMQDEKGIKSFMHPRNIFVLPTTTLFKQCVSDKHIYIATKNRFRPTLLDLKIALIIRNKNQNRYQLVGKQKKKADIKKGRFWEWIQTFVNSVTCFKWKFRRVQGRTTQLIDIGGKARKSQQFLTHIGWHKISHCLKSTYSRENDSLWPYTPLSKKHYFHQEMLCSK